MMRRIIGAKLLHEKSQPQDILGTFTLVNTINIKKFSSHAFANAIHKVCFHTGIMEKELMELIGKTLIQAELKTDGFSTFHWNLYFDKPLEEPPTLPPEPSTPTIPIEATSQKKKSVTSRKSNKDARNGQVFYVQEETKQLEGGFVFSIKFRPGDDFLIIMPITGEKVKSVVKRRTNTRAVEGIYYEQTIHFPNGSVDAVYTKTESGGLKVNLHHVPSRISAEVVFKKAFSD